MSTDMLMKDSAQQSLGDTVCGKRDVPMWNDSTFRMGSGGMLVKALHKR